MAGDIQRLFKKIFAEVEKGLKLYVSYRVWILSDVISTPFWVMFIALGILVYAQQRLRDPMLTSGIAWGIFVLFFISIFLWSGNSVVAIIQQGILENLILTNTGLLISLLGRMVMSSIDVLVGGVIILYFSSYFFNTTIYVADPLFFMIFLFIAFLSFIFFSAIYAALLTVSRSPNLVTSVLQFLIPFFSGAIPIQLFDVNIARFFMYSPFFYLINPILSAATGYYVLDKFFLLQLSLSVVIGFALASFYIQKVLIRKALKKGNFTLF